MSETYRRKFSKEEVESRLSRRRFTMATTGAVVMAMGTRNAWAQTTPCEKCDNTALVFRNLSMTKIFGSESTGGESLDEILRKANLRLTGTPKERMVAVRRRVRARDAATAGPKMHYRDFFVTPEASTYTEVMDKLVLHPEIKRDLKRDMDSASDYFQLPMMILPSDHLPGACRNAIDGWTHSGVEVAGVIKTFGSETLDSILNNAPDYSRPNVPWRWRKHLLSCLNLFGLTSMTNGADTNYAARYASQLKSFAGGANQCAYYTPTGGWACASSPGDKCVLDGSEPAEGTDLCDPPSS